MRRIAEVWGTPVRSRRLGVRLAAGVVAVAAAAPVGVLAAGGPAAASSIRLFVSATGHDTGNCRSRSAPCATISYAVGQVAPGMSGATVHVGPGTFSDNVAQAISTSITIRGSKHGKAPVTTVEPANTSRPIFSTDRNDLTLIDLTLDGEGGASVESDYGSTITVLDSTIVDSSTAVCGCGPTGDVVVGDSTIVGNTVGADVVASGDVSIYASTIAGNGTGVEGGPYGPALAATILADNTGQDCVISSGSVTDDGYNLDQDGTCDLSAAKHDLSDLNPDLGTLTDNGGPTDTELPAADSPVLKKIPKGARASSSVLLCPTTDQRGVSSPEGSRCDIGAVQR